LTKYFAVESQTEQNSLRYGFAVTDVLTELKRAEQHRDRLRERAAWWEDRKELILLPAMIGGLAGGYFLGMWIAAVAKLPELANWFGAVFGLVFVGQWIQRFFDPRKLISAQRRVDALRAKHQAELSRLP
jgi:predicted lipid-binding transport protein (Tim44 family)